MVHESSVSAARGRLATVGVVGSVNRDISVRAERFPVEGETILGDEVVYGLGGKGANQAVAAACAGARTLLCATVGADEHGADLRAELEGLGVETQWVRSTPDARTGTAHITVDRAGRNHIIVVAGANAVRRPDSLPATRAFVESADVVVIQCEIPGAMVTEVIQVAAESGTPLVLNLAPFVALPPEVLEAVEVLVVNVTEAEQLLGHRVTSSPEAATAIVQELAELAPTAILTLGSAGAAYARRGGAHGVVPAPALDVVVDTTGAGDAFVGFLAARIAQGSDLHGAVEAAVNAASATVALPGAAPSYRVFRASRVSAR